MPQVDHRLETLAYHEAGHVVIAMEFGRQVAEVWIDPATGRGLTVYGYGDRIHDDTASICISMAGRLAEEKFDGSSESFSAGDVFKHFEALRKGEKEQAWPEATDLRKIAMDLYDEDTTYDSIIAAVAHYWEATNALLNNPRIWADVTKVAEALLRRRRLDSRALKRLLGARGP